jgi:prealbumin domain-containing protein
MKVSLHLPSRVCPGLCLDCQPLNKSYTAFVSLGPLISVIRPLFSYKELADRVCPCPQGPPGQGVLFGHLIVIKHVDNSNGGGTAQASDFIIHVSGNHQSPDTFPGSETGTDVKLGFGSYQVTEVPPCNPSTNCQYSAVFSTDCSGVIHIDETKTCTVTNVFHPLG